MDLAGKLGEPIDVVLEDDGIADEEGQGCSVVPSAPTGLWILASVLVGLGRRRV